MGFNTNGLTVFYKPWFAGTPTNAKKSTATLTFSGAVIVAETVIIGTEVYEFVAVAGGIADPANIPVVVGVDLTADNAVTQLALEISSNSSLVDAVPNTTTDTVLLIFDNVGTESNSIAISTTCTNGTFGVGVTTLLGGQYATPCNTSAGLIVLDGTIYYTDKPASKWTEDAWYSCVATLL